MPLDAATIAANLRACGITNARQLEQIATELLCRKPTLPNCGCQSLFCQSKSGIASPLGAVVPDFVGQYYNATGSHYSYVSTGLTSADWKQLSGTGIVFSVGSPDSVMLPDYIGQIAQDTTTGILWQSTGLTVDDWDQIDGNVMLTGIISPIGSVVPQFIGQLYKDTVGNDYFRSTGLTDADWSII